MIWFQLTAGLYLILMSFVTTTENLRSALIFRVIPFILGAGEVLLFLSNYGVIYING